MEKGRKMQDDTCRVFRNPKSIPVGLKAQKQKKDTLTQPSKYFYW